MTATEITHSTLFSKVFATWDKQAPRNNYKHNGSEVICIATHGNVQNHIHSNQVPWDSMQRPGDHSSGRFPKGGAAWAHVLSEELTNHCDNCASGKVERAYTSSSRVLNPSSPASTEPHHRNCFLTSIGFSSLTRQPRVSMWGATGEQEGSIWGERMGSMWRAVGDTLGVIRG